jgi:hypothetical protein
MSKTRSIYLMSDESINAAIATLKNDGVPYQITDGSKLTLDNQFSRYITQFYLEYQMKSDRHLRFGTTGLPLPPALVNKTFTCPIEASFVDETLSKINRCYYSYFRKPGTFVDGQYT